MALYRTYRPLSFADVVGQEPIVTTLEQAVEQDKLSHAYLFAGSRGTGKTSVARILAKHIMTRGIADEALRKQIVKGIEEGSIVDLLEIDAASNRGIDDVRDLIEKIQFSPVVAAAKVYIIDEAHMITKDAFNALLKTLEEPPAYAHFILATTELHKIPVTIQSRCQCFPFRPVGEEDIVRRLQYIADQERIVVDREALRLIARHVEGGLRDAISLLDQMRSLPKITVKEVEQRIGTSGHEHTEAIVEAIRRRDNAAIVDGVKRIEEAGVPLDLFLRQFLHVVRGDLHRAIEEKLPVDEHLRAIDILLEALRDIRLAPVPGLAVEAALLSLSTPPSAKKEAAVAGVPARDSPKILVPARDSPKIPIPTRGLLPQKRAEKGQEKQPQEKVETQKDAGLRPAEEKKNDLSTAEVEAPDITMETMRAAWPTILEDTNPAAVRMSLKNGDIRDIAGTRVTVSFSSAFHRDKVAATEASRVIESAMQKIFRRSLKLECVLEKDREQNDGPKESVVNLAEAAAEVF